MTDVLNDPRISVKSYLVTPTGYDLSSVVDKHHFLLKVSDGGKWGWRISEGVYESQRAMNRKGEWIFESRGSGSNRFRRWPLEEALAIALKFVSL